MAHKQLHARKSAEGGASWFFVYCILCSLSVSFGVYWAFCSSYNLHPIQVIAIFPDARSSSSSSNNLFDERNAEEERLDHRPHHQEQVAALALPNASFDQGVPAEKDDQFVYGDQLQRRGELDDLVIQDEDPCHGKRVYMYDDLPRRFNAEILEKCDRKLVSWLSICAHLINHGFGKQLQLSNYSSQDDDPFQGWYATDPYMLELIFHSRMRHYRCLSPTPAEADAFFIPYYSGLDALRFLYGADYASRHEQGIDLVTWLEQRSDSWRRRLGHDHFIVTGRTAWDFASYKGKSSWGTGLRLLKQLENVTSLVMERRPWIEQEQAIPYPTSFHPSTKSQLQNWLRRVEKSSSRRYLMGFVGAPRAKENIRRILFEQCQASASCNVVNCSQIRCAHNPVPIAQQLLVSTFCLQPQGDTYTRRSTFDSLVCGCIPVFFHKHSAYTQYTWHLPEDPESYSVFIPEESVRNGLCVEEFLRNNYSAERVAELRRNIRQLIPRLIYFHPPSLAAADGLDGVEDAFDVSIQAMIKRAASRSSSSSIRR